ncbi:MAG: hypothetical protein GZ086_01325 [Gelidibacter sp.]|nr:hypothetical protein [Gelidibacter sp.]
MSKETEEFLDKIDFNQFENLVPEIFGENHIKIKDFDDLRQAIKLGKIKLNFTFDSKIAKEFLSSQNYGFYNGIRNIKLFGAVIYMLYMLIAFWEYKFLLVLPITWLLNTIVIIFWRNRLLTFIILISLLFAVPSYFNLNINYKVFLISYFILDSITFSSYSIFLSEYFSRDEIVFDYGIKQQIISQVYDGYTKRTLI